VSQPTLALWLVLVSCIAGLSANGPVWDEDEAAYAGFGRTMVRTGDWVVPTFPFSRIHRKAPFHFWSVAASFRVLGESNWALRLPNWVAFALLLLTLWKGLGRLASDEEAKFTALVQGSTLLVLALLRVSVTDAWLLLFTTWAVLGVARAVSEPGWRANVMLWGGVSLGVLTKGPPVLIVAGGVWLTLAAFHPQRRRLVSTHPWLFLPLALVPMALWVWATWQRDSGALATFLWEWYVAKRVGGSVLGQKGWPGYHAVVLAVCYLPFLPSLVPALGALRQTWRQSSTMVLLAWLLWGWLFFEFMSSKLPTYSLAAQPALSLLVARQFANRLPASRLMATSIAALAWLALVATAVAWPTIVHGWPQVASLSLGIAAAITGLVLASTLSLAAVAMWRGWAATAMGAQLYAWPSTFVCALLLVLPTLDASPLKGIQHGVAAWVGETAKAVVWVEDPAQRQPSLPLAVQRRFEQSVVVDDPAAARDALPAVVFTDDGGRAALEALGVDFSRAESVSWWDTDHNLRVRTMWILPPPQVR
jgi:4-amino-4-deoxy-L-arabinose transferase-like glycosyltransferase